jgi:outer membrane PBP1 activator LpoA protein
LRGVVRGATLRAMTRALATIFLSVMLAACASHAPSDTAATSATTPASAATNVLAGTPMAAYGHALNKAKNVQNIVNEQAKKQAAQIDAATGSSG